MKESELKTIQPGDMVFLKKPFVTMHWGSVFIIHRVGQKNSGWVTVRFWNGMTKLCGADELLRRDPGEPA